MSLGAQEVDSQPSRRKRKQQQGSDSDDDDDKMAVVEAQQKAIINAKVPRTDKDEINSIINKCLWSDDADEVADAMDSLFNMLHPYYPNSYMKIKGLHFTVEQISPL